MQFMMTTVGHRHHADWIFPVVDKICNKTSLKFTFIQIAHKFANILVLEVLAATSNATHHGAAIARAPSTDALCSLTFALRYLHKADMCKVLLHGDGLQQSVFNFPPIVSRLQGVTLPALDLKIRPI